MNPYRIEQPAVVMVSGGRTSGFMLAKIIEAFGGSLPEDVIPVFCNTGLEHAATYEFLHEIETRWCPIRWLEYRSKEDGHTFVEVNYETASRNGEPFESLIRKANYLPNPVTRKCTSELKVRTAIRFVDSLGWVEHVECVGLRADEQRRVAKIKGDAKRVSLALPIAEAGHTLQDVLAFWRSQPFDLRLPNNDNAFGNCQLCFLKSKARLRRVMQHDPSAADWWIRMEHLGLASKPSGATFRSDRPSYAGLLWESKNQANLFDDEEDTIPCACTD